MTQFEKTERVIELKIVDHLSEEQLKKLNVKRKNPHEPKMKPHHERVDWNNIMGGNRDIYTSRGNNVEI
ncbi:hypothetical protein [Rossellomorea marisflavi]|uniref:hypothetical protein n=1 Tax=Rossellomorea marisflavi TaxID=189381 RepID=UPI001EE27058|nr:hypothetical protein [Rossellomorea marisflavi]UKS64698.1 hypothetical protein K6T23_18265 [Rossellomorea marisflavi]